MGGEVGRVVPKASLEECKNSDLIVAVKRINHPFFENIKKSGRPWIWDLVDFYPQPQCGKWSKAEAISWVQRQIKLAKPNGIIYPNKQMMLDIGFPGVVIYHHSREQIKPITVKQKVQSVGYDGGDFLGRWEFVVKTQCHRRGWEFKKDWPDKLDIVLAFRDGMANGYAQKSWKSNVKLANAHASGTPFVGAKECSYVETGTGREIFIETPEHLSNAFDYLEDYETRKAIHESFVKNTIPLGAVSAQLEDYADQIFRGSI